MLPPEQRIRDRNEILCRGPHPVPRRRCAGAFRSIGCPYRNGLQGRGPRRSGHGDHERTSAARRRERNGDRRFVPHPPPAAPRGPGDAGRADAVLAADRPGDHRRRRRPGLRRVHPLPVHRLPGRAGLRLGRAGRPAHPVLPQHGDRALHAGHRRDGADRLQPVLAALGPGLRDPDLLRQPVAGLGDQLGDAGHLPVRRRAAVDRDRHAARHRADPDPGPGGLRRAGAGPDAQGRRGAAADRGRRDLRHRRRRVGRPAAGRHAPGSRPPSSASPLLLGALAFAGAGGGQNLVQSNWIRDKGFGMGSYVPRLASPVTGKPEAAPEHRLRLRADRGEHGALARLVAVRQHRAARPRSC